MFCETLCRRQEKASNFTVNMVKGHGQGYKVIMHVKFEISISYSSKVTAKVKVNNRHTDRPNKISMPPIIQSKGIKILSWLFETSCSNTNTYKAGVLI